MKVKLKEIWELLPLCDADIRNECSEPWEPFFILKNRLHPNAGSIHPGMIRLFGTTIDVVDEGDNWLIHKVPLEDGLYVEVRLWDWMIEEKYT